MPDIAERPAEGATKALARDPGDVADTLDEGLVAALLTVREARERLRRVDAILARIVASITPTDGGEP